MNNHKHVLQLAAKLEALRDEYMRFAVEKCSTVLREYCSAVETIAGWFTSFLLTSFSHQFHEIFEFSYGNLLLVMKYILLMIGTIM